MKIDKSRLKDSMGKPLTQGLFIEINYNPELAVYTLNDEDKEYKGVIYPSLKRLFMETEDPTGYRFAITYLLGWEHFKRLKANKQLAPYFERWSEELEVAMLSEQIARAQELSVEEKGFQAVKWLADKGWEKRKPGRPSNEELERNIRVSQKVREQFDEDYERLKDNDGEVATGSIN